MKAFQLLTFLCFAVLLVGCQGKQTPAPVEPAPAAAAKTPENPAPPKAGAPEKPAAPNADPKKDEPELSVDKYCEMMGKLMPAIAPLVVGLKKDLEGKPVEERIRIGAEYEKRIDAVSTPIYQEYGVAKEWANKAGREKKYGEAFKDYMDKHPDVKAAVESMR